LEEVQIASFIGDLGYPVVQPKLVILAALERLAALARRLRLGFLVDALAPHLSRPFERFALDVGGVRLHGTDLAQLHYVRELAEQGRDRPLSSSSLPTFHPVGSSSKAARTSASQPSTRLGQPAPPDA